MGTFEAKQTIKNEIKNFSLAPDTFKKTNITENFVYVIYRMDVV